MSDGLDPSWQPEDLGAIFRHQLSAPIDFDLSGLDPGVVPKLETAATSRGLVLRSFADLLHHPNPPVELLRLTKQFARANHHHPDSPLPHEVATLLYFASIAAALLHCEQRITELDDAALKEGFTWARGQTWIDDATRSLLDDASRVLGDEGGRQT